MYKHLFGPVPSRRLGMSLGVDLVPHKVCTLNCVYCECGVTTNITIERKEYVPVLEVIDELKHFFTENPKPDYITFSGAGEPTLNSGIGKVLNFIKENIKVPVALITNGTLFNNKNVRDEIYKTDLILPSLDAVTSQVFNKINRPEKRIKIEDCISGLISFCKEYKGLIWLEILILHGYNDHPDELVKFKEIICEINPEIIQINTLDRPGVVQNIRSATISELNAVVDFLNLPNIQLVSKIPKRNNIKAYRKDIESVIIETLSRRPCTIQDLAEILGKKLNELNKYLDVLESENKINSTLQERGIFYQIK